MVLTANGASGELEAIELSSAHELIDSRPWTRIVITTHYCTHFLLLHTLIVLLQLSYCICAYLELCHLHIPSVDVEVKMRVGY